jgi:cytochrome P450
VNAAFAFDPTTRAFQTDPYPVYQVLRDHFPVYRSESRDFYALSRFADVQSASRDWKTFSSADGIELDNPNTSLGTVAGSFIDADPPNHDVLRKLVQPRFSPAEVRELEVTIRSIISRHFASLVANGGGDVAELVAIPTAVGVTAAFLGLPSRDVEALCPLTIAMVSRSYDSILIPDSAQRAGRELADYLLGHFDDPSQLDPSGVLGHLRTVAVGSRRLSRPEWLGMALLLLIAGMETTAGFMSSCLLWLDTHRDQFEVIAAEPETIPVAVEELLRFDPPVQSLARTAKSDITLHGTTIPAGSRVLLLHGAACRDDRRYVDPHRLDVKRPPARSVAFGDGIHFCLGAPIARMEARFLLELLVAQGSSYAVVAPPERIPSNLTRPIASLKVTL